MEFRIVLFLLLFSLNSCVQHTADEEIPTIQDLPVKQLTVKYAKGFDLEYTAQYTKIITRSIEGNTFFADSVFLKHKGGEELKKGSKIIPSKLKSLCCQSSTHLAFIDLLGQVDKVTGLCGTQYLGNSQVKEKLNNVKEICLGEALQTEEILALSPDLYFVYPFASEDLNTLDEQGVRTLMIAEYLEEHPIARLEWIKLYGVLFHMEEEADSYFNEVEEEYYSLVQDPDTNKRFFLNLPYGDSWYTPSANSLIVKLLEDGGLSYYYQNETGTENTPHTQEEMWQTGSEANYWVIIADRPADFTVEDLIKEDEVYRTFKSVIHHQVIFCNTATSDYFVRGVVEPHVMLRDILFATHQLSDHQPQYFQLLK